MVKESQKAIGLADKCSLIKSSHSHNKNMNNKCKICQREFNQILPDEYCVDCRRAIESGNAVEVEPLSQV